jgi:shikimate dehydrogenase
VTSARINFAHHSSFHHHSSFIIHHSSFIIHHSSFIRFIIIIHHSSFIIHHSSFSSSIIHPSIHLITAVMTDRYAVIGNPVAHSRSPLIHAEFARQTGEDISYDALLAPLDGFRDTALDFRDKGGRGLNVTLPFKHEAWRLADQSSERAKQARAVNTLKFDAGAIVGDNTDGVGLVRDIESNLGFDLTGKRLLILGAGGAAWGVVTPLLAKPILRLTIANRTVSKALELRQHLGGFSNVEACGFDALAGSQFDLVINATSAGLDGEAPPISKGVFAPGAFAYEMVYGRVTPFMTLAGNCGARVADGLGMLVEQAAVVFIWRSVRPGLRPSSGRWDRRKDEGGRGDDKEGLRGYFHPSSFIL